jgi:hypothetical protein
MRRGGARRTMVIAMQVNPGRARCTRETPKFFRYNPRSMYPPKGLPSYSGCSNAYLFGNVLPAWEMNAARRDYDDP